MARPLRKGRGGGKAIVAGPLKKSFFCGFKIIMSRSWLLYKMVEHLGLHTENLDNPIQTNAFKRSKVQYNCETRRAQLK